MDITISEMLARNARVYPDDIALVERVPAEKKRTEITWKEFDDRANQFASVLVEKGINKGDKVVHWMQNSISWLVAYFGIVRTGAWVVPLNFRFTADDLKYCCDVAEPKLIVFDEEFTGRIEASRAGLAYVNDYICVGRNTPSFAGSFADLIAGASDKPPGRELLLSDPCGLYFTSGTTGQPKPILLTHNNMACACITENVHHYQTKDDVFILIPPLYHTGAKMHWFGSLISGSKAILLKGTKPHDILQTVSDERCTIVWLLVPWAQDILNALDSGELKLSDYHLKQWRLMHIGAQPVPKSLIRHWKEYFPQHQYDTNYGLSESIGPGCVHLGVDHIDKVGAIGIPGYGWKCMIVDEERNEIKDSEVVGELAVKGPGVMTCYYKDPEATDEVLSKDGWLYTGDMAKRDADGFYYLVDRKKDVIISGGENIYPVQIEDFLHGFDPIDDVAVIGLADPRLGEKTAAIIQVKKDHTCTKEDVENFCQKLPRYKRPREIIFADVPRNPTGKIEKPKLRKLYGADNLVAAENQIS